MESHHSRAMSANDARRSRRGRAYAVMTTVAMGAVGAMLCITAAHAACAVTDIEIKEWSWSRDAGWFSIVGELANNCAEPAGAQLQITFRDAEGRVVSIEEAWAGGTRNILPKGSYAFQTSSRGYATAKNLSIRVINVRRWP
jgi:hypothetical protein